MFVSFCYSKIDFYNFIFFFNQTSLSFPYHFFFLGTPQFLCFLWLSPLLLSDIFASESLFWESQDTFLGDATGKGGSDFADGSCSLIPCLSIQWMAVTRLQSCPCFCCVQSPVLSSPSPAVTASPSEPWPLRFTGPEVICSCCLFHTGLPYSLPMEKRKWSALMYHTII